MGILKGSTIIGGGKKEDRQDNDFYPTPAEVTIALMNFLKLSPMKIWEPACGDGAISEILLKYNHKVTSTELRLDGGYGEGGIDFLTANPLTCDMICTNPPFNLAEYFIRKALEYAKIAAIMTKSTYWHAKKRLPLFQDNLPAFILPLTWRPDFMGGGAPTMDCMWTVWIEGQHEAKYVPLEKPVTQQKLF